MMQYHNNWIHRICLKYQKHENITKHDTSQNEHDMISIIGQEKIITACKKTVPIVRATRALFVATKHFHSACIFTVRAFSIFAFSFQFSFISKYSEYKIELEDLSSHPVVLFYLINKETAFEYSKHSCLMLWSAKRDSFFVLSFITKKLIAKKEWACGANSNTPSTLKRRPQKAIVFIG